MIGFVESIRNGFQQYASVRGRASRAEYWWWVVFNAIVQLLLGESLLGRLAVLALIVPSIAVLVRRLHDLDRSAWYLLAVLVPAVGIIFLVVLLALPGTVGSNRYGPPRVPSGPAPGQWRPGDLGGSGGSGGSGGWDFPPPPPPSR